MKPKKIASRVPKGTSSQVPARLSLFGPAPLLEGENPADYDELLVRVSAAVKPADILEEIWVDDVVNLVWDALRLRRHKANLLSAQACKELTEILIPVLGLDEATNLANRWAMGHRDAIDLVSEELVAAGLTIDSLMAQALSLQIDTIERIDRMIMSAEGRRHAVLREIDRHRATVAMLLRQASDLISARPEPLETMRLTDRRSAA